MRQLLPLFLLLRFRHLLPPPPLPGVLNAPTSHGLVVAALLPSPARYWWLHCCLAQKHCTTTLHWFPPSNVTLEPGVGSMLVVCHDEAVPSPTPLPPAPCHPSPPLPGPLNAPPSHEANQWGSTVQCFRLGSSGTISTSPGQAAEAMPELHHCTALSASSTPPYRVFLFLLCWATHCLPHSGILCDRKLFFNFYSIFLCLTPSLPASSNLPQTVTIFGCAQKHHVGEGSLHLWKLRSFEVSIALMNAYFRYLCYNSICF